MRVSPTRAIVALSLLVGLMAAPVRGAEPPSEPDVKAVLADTGWSPGVVVTPMTVEFTAVTSVERIAALRAIADFVNDVPIGAPDTAAIDRLYGFADAAPAHVLTLLFKPLPGYRLRHDQVAVHVTVRFRHLS